MFTAETTDARQRLDRQGYAVVEALVAGATLDRWLAAIEREQAARGETNLRRPLDAVAELNEALAEPMVVALLNGLFDRPWSVVRAILFDKTPAKNWSVGWHQDQCVAVRERAEVEGYGPWSVKAGVVHVEPPVNVLERMVTLRLHLDDCGDANGPLKVVPGSHRLGRLDAARTAAVRGANGVVTCAVGRGGAVLMKPLTLHASRPAASPRHRRVLHLECADFDLPAPLAWHERRR